MEAASEIRFTDQAAVDAYLYLDFLRDILQEAEKKGAATVAGHCVDFPKAIEITETLRDKFFAQYLDARKEGQGQKWISKNYSPKAPLRKGDGHSA